MNSRVCNINQQKTTYSVWQHRNTKNMLGELSVLVWVTQTTNRKSTIRKSNSKSYNERITLGSKRKDNCRKYISI